MLTPGIFMIVIAGLLGVIFLPLFCYTKDGYCLKNLAISENSWENKSYNI